MLNALSSTLKNESDDQSRNAPPTMPSAVAFDWMPRTARRIESSDVFGNVFESWRTKNEPSSAWWTRPSSASDEEEQRHEREEREVRDHRGQVRAAVGEELAQDSPHWAAVCSQAWMQPRRSAT